MNEQSLSIIPGNQLQTLQWQFNLTWKLAQFHLPGLTMAACLWEPAPNCWTVRQSLGGSWRPDWSVPEPDPAPPVTIGWLTWHLIWWWSNMLSAMHGKPVIPHTDMDWPGSAEQVILRLDTLAAEWEQVLNSLSEGDLEKPLAHPWEEPRPLRYAIAWVNMELMKNIAEIGTVRHLYETSRLPK